MLQRWQAQLVWERMLWEVLSNQGILCLLGTSPIIRGCARCLAWPWAPESCTRPVPLSFPSGLLSIPSAGHGLGPRCPRGRWTSWEEADGAQALTQVEPQESALGTTKDQQELAGLSRSHSVPVLVTGTATEGSGCVWPVNI